MTKVSPIAFLRLGLGLGLGLGCGDTSDAPDRDAGLEAAVQQVCRNEAGAFTYREPDGVCIMSGSQDNSLGAGLICDPGSLGRVSEVPGLQGCYLPNCGDFTCEHGVCERTVAANGSPFFICECPDAACP